MQRDDVVDRIAACRRSTHSFFTVRVRALLTLGTILALGTAGTFAAWANSAVATGTFSTGTIDLRANDTKSFTFSALSMTGMLPGESQAASLQVQNTRSTMDVTYTVNVTTLREVPRSRTTFSSEPSAAEPHRMPPPGVCAQVVHRLPDRADDSRGGELRAHCHVTPSARCVHRYGDLVRGRHAPHYDAAHDSESERAGLVFTFAAQTTV